MLARLGALCLAIGLMACASTPEPVRLEVGRTTVQQVVALFGAPECEDVGPGDIRVYKYFAARTTDGMPFVSVKKQVPGALDGSNYTAEYLTITIDIDAQGIVTGVSHKTTYAYDRPSC
ncbi:MAG TPA: hypothetical protein VK779_00070 [Rhizomicrobium sp.]|jgi:hypothetical protein|nr:hypothetical protein [Rhizomicrobium sp.]